MNRHFSEQVLSLAERDILHKETIRANVLNAAPEHRAFPIRRILIPVAACLAALIIAVFAVPSARAEVLSWFGIARPAEQYLVQSEHAQTPVDELITTAAPKDTQSRILSVVDEPIWQQIANDFSITLNESMFDGNDLYISMTLKGLTALPEIDALTGGRATGTALTVEELEELFEDGNVPGEYRTGEATYVENAAAGIYLLLPDGTELSCGPIRGLDLNEGFEAYLKELNDAYPEQQTAAIHAAISERNMRWLKERALTGVAKCQVRNPRTGKGFATVELHNGVEIEIQDVWALLLENAGENGLLTASVRYKTAAERDSGFTTLLEADLGTITVDLYAYERLPSHTLSANAETVWESGTAILSFEKWRPTEDGADAVITMTNTEVSLSGLALRIKGGGTINALGIENVRIAVSMPEAWTTAEREAFLSRLSFYTEIDGERFISGAFSHDSDADGDVLLTFHDRQLSYDKLDGAQTIRLIPVLQTITANRTTTGSIPLPLNTPVEGDAWESEQTVYSDHALMLTIEP